MNMNISCRITNANTQCGRITNPPERVLLLKKYKMKRLLIVCIISMLFSCSVQRKASHHDYIQIYRPVVLLPATLPQFIFIRPHINTYEIYDDYVGGLLGNYTISNDTMILFHKNYYGITEKNHDFVMEIPDTLNFKKFLYPKKLLIKEDSLIDVTDYGIYGYSKNVIEMKEKFIRVE